MARVTKPLTNTEVERAKPKDKDYSLMDGQGLFLRVKTNGLKSWLFNYYRPISNKRTNLGIGTYPEITLAQARVIRDEYRALLAKGIDQQIHRQEQEIAQRQALSNTFYKVAESWRLKRQNDVEPLTMEKNWQRLEKYLFAKLGHYPISSISPFVLVETLKPLSAAGKVVSVEWSEIDWDEKLWHIPAEKMKKTKKGRIAILCHFLPKPWRF